MTSICRWRSEQRAWNVYNIYKILLFWLQGSIWKTDGNLLEPGSDKHQAKFDLKWVDSIWRHQAQRYGLSRSVARQLGPRQGQHRRHMSIGRTGHCRSNTTPCSSS